MLELSSASQAAAPHFPRRLPDRNRPTPCPDAARMRAGSCLSLIDRLCLPDEWSCFVVAAQSCPVSLSTEASSSQATLHTEFTLVAAEQKKQPLRCFDTCTKTHSRVVRALRSLRFLSSLFLSPMLYDGDFECGEQSPPQPATPIKTPGRQRRARRKRGRGEAGADRPTGARAAARRTSDSPSPSLFSPPRRRSRCGGNTRARVMAICPLETWVSLRSSSRAALSLSSSSSSSSSSPLCFRLL